MSLTLLSLSFLSASQSLAATLDVNKTVDQLLAGGKDVAKWLRECTPFELPESGYQCACINMDPAKATQYCHSKQICDTGVCVDANPETAKKNCTDTDPCYEAQGDCDWSKDCLGELVCGNANCHRMRSKFEDWPAMTLRGYHVSDYNGGVTNDDCCCKKGTPECGSKRERKLIKPGGRCNIHTRCVEGYACRVRTNWLIKGSKCVLYAEGLDPAHGDYEDVVVDDDEDDGVFATSGDNTAPGGHQADPLAGSPEIPETLAPTKMHDGVINLGKVIKKLTPEKFLAKTSP